MTVETRLFKSYSLHTRFVQTGLTEVWLASQINSRREVVIKLVKEAPGPDSRAVIERFEREAAVIIQLDHPHILSTLEFGREDGYFYMVTPFIQGGTLHERMRREPLTHRQSVNIFKQLMSALCFAHRRGIFHGHLTPRNIRLREDWRPAITNFGVTRTEFEMRLAAGENNPYSAPEQRSGPGSFRGDLYAMGAILYELLTGQPYYSGLAGQPRPALPHPLVPPPLEDFLLKALSRFPGQRFTSADEMSAAFLSASLHLTPADLQTRPEIQPEDNTAWPVENSDGAPGLIDTSRSFQTSSLISQVTPRKSEQTGEKQLILAGLATLAVVAAVIGWLILGRDRPETGRTDPVNGPGAGFVAPRPNVTRPVQPGRTATAGDRPTQPRQTPAGPAGQTPVETPAPVSKITLAGHSAPVNRVAWSADGRLLVTASDDKTLKIWDAAGRLILTLDDKQRPHTGPVVAARWSADGQYIVSAAADKQVHIYNTKTGVVLLQASDGLAARDVAIAPDNSLVTYPGPNVLRSWAWLKDDNGPDFALKPAGSEVAALAFSPDSKYLAAGISDNRIIVWEVAGGQERVVISPAAGSTAPLTLAWSPDGRQLAVARQKSVELFELNPATGTAGPPTAFDTRAPVAALEFSPDSKQLAAGSQNGEVEIRSTAEANQPPYRFSSGPNPVTGLHWSGDSLQLSVASGGSQPSVSTFALNDQ